MSYFGKYAGYVRANDDPEKRLRIRCYCPAVMGAEDSDSKWLGWAEACLPWMGGISTANFGPPYTKDQNNGEEVGVWLEFRAGNVDFPIYCGTFVVAPTADDPRAQLDLDTVQGVTAGGLVGSPPGGSDMSAIDPPKPEKYGREVRLIAKEGVDIIIGSANGGFLILGPSGAHLTGSQTTLNGRSVVASRDKAVG